MADVTIYTIAKELNMSPSMVSRAFNPDGKIREDKRQLVLKTAEKYGFSPNKFASRLSMKTVQIGVVINCKFKINTDKMLEGLRRAYEKFKDYKIKCEIDITNTGKDASDLVMKYAGYDGIILAGFGAKKYADKISALAEKNPNIVQVQSVNEHADCLFTSKHDEKIAAEMAAEFLYNCLKNSNRKNVVLFTGDLETALHSNAKNAFEKACKELDLNILETADMKDNEDVLRCHTEHVFERYGDKIDGVYITSGESLSLCEYIQKSQKNISLVTFDIYDKIGEYLKNGVISATISQNVPQQMENAFEMLVRYLINGEKPRKTVYTDVQLVLKSNMHLVE